MATYAQARAAARAAAAQSDEQQDADEGKPRRVVLVAREAFAETWALRPSSDQAIGLRLISSAEVQGAMAAGAEQVGRWHQDRESGRLHDLATAADAYNDAFMRHAVARGTCDPNAVDKPYFALAEDTVRDALTEEGVRYLWDELRILHVTSSAAILPAQPAEIAQLARILLDGSALEALDPQDRPELLRLVSHVRAMLLATGKAVERQPGAGDDGYMLRLRKR